MKLIKGNICKADEEKRVVPISELLYGLQSSFLVNRHIDSHNLKKRG